MKKTKITVLLLFALGAALTFQMNACKVSGEVSAKTGVQLWGENCVRCHSAISPADFSDTQWELIGDHMRIRASLTYEETEKIIQFLQSAN
jgi:hypothetical protein